MVAVMKDDGQDVNCNNGMHDIGMMVDYDGMCTSELDEVTYFLCQHVGMMVVDDRTHAHELEKVSCFYFEWIGIAMKIDQSSTVDCMDWEYCLFDLGVD